MLEKIIDNFVEEYIERSQHALKEEIKDVLKDMECLLKEKKDASLEEIVEAILDDCVRDLNGILQNYSMPGIVSGLNVGNIHVNLHGGTIRPNEDILTEEALFDVASITKLYTEILAYKLIQEGAFSLTDKISDLDPKFENMQGLMVADILRFSVTFKTDGRIEDASTKEEAREKLFDMQVLV